MSLVTTSINGLVQPGEARRGGGPSASRPPMPHISDLTSVSAGVDPNLPIRKLLDEGHGCMRQAETCRSFGRPDVALQEYIRGSAIAVEIIPRHKDYVSLRGDRGGLARLYDALKHKVHSASPVFEAIKEEIKADNARTGVLPKVRGMERPGPTENDSRPSTASSTKAKPVVHPKPQALHGNAIKPGSAGNRASTGSKDLSARFASLGGPASPPKQDPRIRTHPITPMAAPMAPPPPAPRGPRQMPAKRHSDIVLDTSVPNLPKMPAAIYSPARGTVSTEAGQLPSSTSRGLFSRTGSSSSFTNGIPQNQQQSQGSIISNPLPPRSPPPVPPQSLPPIPPGDYLTPQQLCDLMRTRNSQILLIDVRPREDFDDGHILAQATICIEPSVLLRDNISATEIAESNILAPIEEQQRFDRRDRFEVVVLYDQDSESIPSRPTTEAGTALMALRRAMLHFSYGRELQNAPKLLKGGVDAWTDFMGAQALRTTSTAHKTPRPEPRESEGALTRSAWTVRRPSKHVVKPLKPEEVKQWQETLRKEEMDASQSPNFVRSTEDFLRRFPPVAVEQESMTAPEPPASRPPPPPTQLPQGRPDALAAYADLPSPPTRPAPAVPRVSYSGLGQLYDAGAGAAQEGPPARESPSVRKGLKKPEGADPDDTHFTGLHNPNVWCYANSTLQALRVTPGFGKELEDFKRKNNWLLFPGINAAQSPQLMSNMLANLFQWMSLGCFKAMRASTLMDYCRYRTKTWDAVFGGCNQQDASEWLTFLLDQVQLETDRTGGINKERKMTKEEMKKEKRRIRDMSALEAAVDYWEMYMALSRSMIDRYFRGVEMTLIRCRRCNHISKSLELMTTLNVHPGTDDTTLTQRLSNMAKMEPLANYECDNEGEGKCNGSKGEAWLTRRIARLPEVLVVVLLRYGQAGGLHKLKTLVSFDVDNETFEPYFVPQGQRDLRKPAPDAAFGDELWYRCYGVVTHDGNSLNAGHYVSYVRDLRVADAGGEAPWWKCDDARVEKMPRGRVQAMCRGETKRGDGQPFILFFRRIKRAGPDRAREMA